LFLYRILFNDVVEKNNVLGCYSVFLWVVLFLFCFFGKRIYFNLFSFFFFFWLTSAGGMSVGAHMVAPKSKGLFTKGIMESNPLALPFHFRDTATENANAMMEYLNCPIDDVECMRTKSMEEILEAQDKAPALNLDNLFINFLPWSPLVEEDGEIPMQPLTAMQQGAITQVPMMSGTMQDEGQLFVYELFTKPMSETAYKATILGVFGKENYPRIIEKYPLDVVPGSTDGRQALNVLATDLLFYCPLRNVTVSYQKALGVAALPTFIYRFTHVISFDCWGPDYAFCVGWVCHGSELPFVFHVFDDGVSLYYEPTADELQLTEDLANIWSNFVTRADPNIGLTIPEKFPIYTGVQDTIYEMNEPGTTTQTRYRDQYCNMWDKMGYFY
jgi:carboxylesterase type B